MIFLPGTPRLKLLPAGTTILWLPMPDAGSPTLEFIAKGMKVDLIDGSEAWRQLGWVPKLTMKWAAYDDRAGEGWVLGQANGNRPSMTDLLAVLSGGPGSFSVSPGPSAGGFAVQSWEVSPIGVAYGGIAKGVSITFTGGSILPSMALGAF